MVTSKPSSMLQQVQSAYAAEDYGTLRKLTTPEEVSNLAEELSDHATSGVKNDVRDVTLLQGDVAEAWHEEGQDYATVAMRYSAIDIMRDRATGKVIEGNDSTSRKNQSRCGPSFARAGPTGRWPLSRPPRKAHRFLPMIYGVGVRPRRLFLFCRFALVSRRSGNRAKWGRDGAATLSTYCLFSFIPHSVAAF